MNGLAIVKTNDFAAYAVILMCVKKPSNWRDWLTLDDAALLSHCHVEVFRASGPGGQKRNKTSSAIRIVHEPTGLSARNSTSRSQQDNRQSALKRLRLEIALKLRVGSILIQTPDEWSSLIRTGQIGVTPKSANFPIIVAYVLDRLAAEYWVIYQAAGKLGITTGALSQFLCSDDELLTEVNRQRQMLGMRGLRDG